MIADWSFNSKEVDKNESDDDVINSILAVHLAVQCRITFKMLDLHEAEPTGFSGLSVRSRLDMLLNDVSQLHMFKSDLRSRTME